MSWQEQMYRGLKENGIRMACYVPDNVVGGVIDLLERDEAIQVVPVTREEEGVGVLAGAYLGGMKGALLLQSSGVGNSINALTTLNLAHQIPFVMVISHRGEVGEISPNMMPMGRILERLLDLLAIQHVSLRREEEVRTMVDRVCRTTFRANLPMALLLTSDLAGGHS